MGGKIYEEGKEKEMRRFFEEGKREDRLLRSPTSSFLFGGGPISLHQHQSISTLYYSIRTVMTALLLLLFPSAHCCLDEEEGIASRRGREKRARSGVTTTDADDPFPALCDGLLSRPIKSGRFTQA